MFRNDNKGVDIESGSSNGGGQLYPMMLEPLQLRWAFIRKVYSILSVQLLLTVAVAATVVFVHPISHFVLHTKPGLAVYIVALILPFLCKFSLHSHLFFWCSNYGIFLFGIAYAFQGL